MPPIYRSRRPLLFRFLPTFKSTAPGLYHPSHRSRPSSAVPFLAYFQVYPSPAFAATVYRSPSLLCCSFFSRLLFLLFLYSAWSYSTATSRSSTPPAPTRAALRSSGRRRRRSRGGSPRSSRRERTARVSQAGKRERERDRYCGFDGAQAAATNSRKRTRAGNNLPTPPFAFITARFRARKSRHRHCREQKTKQEQRKQNTQKIKRQKQGDGVKPTMFVSRQALCTKHATCLRAERKAAACCGTRKRQHSTARVERRRANIRVAAAARRWWRTCLICACLVPT